MNKIKIVLERPSHHRNGFTTTMVGIFMFLVLVLSQLSVNEAVPSLAPTFQPSSFISEPLRNYLVAYYPFNGNANDQSGNGNNGVVFAATLGPDRFGNPNSAYVFDGNTSYIKVNDGTPFDFSNNMSVSFWFKAGVVHRINGQYLSKSLSANTGSSWAIEQTGSSTSNDYFYLKYRQYPTETWFFGATFSAWPANQWNHFVCSKSNNLVRNYLNGVLMSSSSAATAQIERNGNLPLYIGSNAGTSNFFIGMMDDILIYNRSLTPSDVIRLYQFESPTSQPSSQPSRLPSSQPSRQPSSHPTSQPSRDPSSQPTTQPSGQPSRQPNSYPTAQPSSQPSSQPSNQPFSRPTGQPSGQPSSQPSNQPFSRPTAQPSGQPSSQPTRQPTGQPSRDPTAQPSSQPSSQPSNQPFSRPTGQPSVQPSSQPSSQPLSRPSSQPTTHPSGQPSTQPSSQPTTQPNSRPSAQPSSRPSGQPSSHPTSQPTNHPANSPSSQPSSQPSAIPTTPSSYPSSIPTNFPSSIPSNVPSSIPTLPSSQPTSYPTSSLPTCGPSSIPSSLPSSPPPTSQPSNVPSTAPSPNPTPSPTEVPSVIPTDIPSSQPSSNPSPLISSKPTIAPTPYPTLIPSPNPSEAPSFSPTSIPTIVPTPDPSTSPSMIPTVLPSISPTAEPSAFPSRNPSFSPSAVPSEVPTLEPTLIPTVAPSAVPTPTPTTAPTIAPSVIPTVTPTQIPTAAPTFSPSAIPTLSPSFIPSFIPSTLPTPNPTYGPTTLPSFSPSQTPSCSPTFTPSWVPSLSPTHAPSISPTRAPTAIPTFAPTSIPLKSMSFSVQLSTVFAKSRTLNGIAFTLSSLPSNSLTVTISLVNTTSIVSPSSWSPNTFTISSTSAITQYSSTLVAGTPGSYRINVALSGPSRSEYNISFTQSRSITVISSSDEPPTPVMQSATFSSDGSYVTVMFSSPTNRAGSTTSFKCNALFKFIGVNSSTCSWQDSSTLLIYQQSSDLKQLLDLNSSITLKSVNGFKALCQKDASICAGWANIAAKTVFVVAPIVTSKPMVQIAGPSQISSCQPLSIDLTASSGNAGRPWNISFQIVSTPTNATNIAQLNRYFARSYQFSPPSKVPMNLLIKGTTYTFTATMENFLGASSSNSLTTVVLQESENVPSVTISGSDSVTIYRRFPLQIKSVAYTVSCSGNISYSNLQYAWSLTVLSGSVSQTFADALQSTTQTRNPSLYTLSAYTLPASSSFRLNLVVTHGISGISSTATATVTVLQGSLVAVISGSPTQSIQLDVATTIDGSTSYDQDKAGVTGRAAGLSYLWTCTQQLPVYKSDCSDVLSFVGTSSTAEKAVVVANNVTALLVTSQLSMTVSDSTRASTAYVYIKVVTSMVNSVIITTSPRAVTALSTSNSLSLTTNLIIYSQCDAKWSVSDNSLDLATISAFPPTQSLSVGKQQFNLRLNPNTLPERANLLFTLKCGSGSSSITVTTNGSPVPGQYEVSPIEGIELSTVFVFVAGLWNDPDLPITYQFGFISPATRQNLVILGRSPTTTASTTLPAGFDGDGNVVNCTLQVFDVLNSTYTMYDPVKVTPVTTASDRKQSLINFISSASSDNVDSQKNLISVASTTLNHINCTVPQNCSSLNRQPCSKTAYTCGPCLPNFQGDSGDKNSLCISVQSFKNSTAIGGTCNSDAQCNQALQRCEDGKCVFLSKRCPGDCSGNGRCRYRYISTGFSLKNCSISELSCEALCSCNTGYTGADCLLLTQDIPQLQRARSVLVNTLNNLTKQDDITTESVPAWANYLNSISVSPDQLALDDLAKVQEIALTTVSAGQDLGVDPSKLTGILTAIDGVTTVQTKSNVTQASTMVGVLSSYGAMVSNGLIYGEDPATAIYTNFRISNSISLLSVDSIAQAEVPKTDIETLIETPKSGISLIPNNETLTANSSYSKASFSISLIQTFEKSYTKNADVFYSDPIQLSLSSTHMNISDLFNENLLSFLIVKIQHNEVYGNFLFGNDTKQNFTSRCYEGIVNTTSFQCTYAPKTIYHHCNGSYDGYLLSYCPIVIPTCNRLNVSSAQIFSNSSCITMNSTKTETICSCPLSFPSYLNTTRRALKIQASKSAKHEPILSEQGGANLVAATEYLGNDFVHTFSAQSTLGGKDGAAKSAIVIGIICFVWGGGFLLLGIVNYREYREALEEKKKMKAELEGQKALNSNASTRTLMKPLKQQILKYIDLILPAVYNIQETFFERTLREIRLHHRYFHLFMVDTRRPNFSDRLYRTVKILSVQTIQMFLQALLFDLQNPEDDGTCPSHKDEATCLQRKTILDQTQTYCSWDGSTNECSYLTPEFSQSAVIYVMIITAICTAMFKTPLDFLLKVWVCPVYEKVDLPQEIKVFPGAGISDLNENDLADKLAANNEQLIISPDLLRRAEQERNHKWIPYLGFRHWIFHLKKFWYRIFRRNEALIKNGQSFMNQHGRSIPKEIIKSRDSTLKNFNVVESYAKSEYENEKSSSEQEKNASLVLGSSYQLRDDVENAKSPSKNGNNESPFINHLCEDVLKYHITLSDHIREKKQKVLGIDFNELPKEALTEPAQNTTDRRKRRASIQLSKEQDRLLQLYEDQWGIKEHLDIPQFLSSHPTSDTDEFREGFDNESLQAYLRFYQNSQKALRKLQPILIRSNSQTAGLELMNLFIVDILGNTTRSARIFRNKFNEDYEIMYLVTRIWKYFCVFLVFALNAFFLYYMLLRGASKGLDWQLQFLKVIISQFAIEIFLFETIECVSLHYLIPESVRMDVKKAVRILQLIADNIDTLIISMDHEVNEATHSTDALNRFDATNYFFISKALAKLRPELLETYIINAYRNPFPGMICHTWSHYKKRYKHHEHLLFAPVGAAEDEDSIVGNNSKKKPGAIEFSSISHQRPQNERANANYFSFFNRSQANGVPNGGSVYGAGSNHEENGNEGDDDDDDLNENNSQRKSWVFILVSSLAAGIIFCLQAVGIMPVFSQRLIIRLLETSILSGLTILWYTAKKQSSYYSIFAIVVVVVVLLFILRYSYRQQAKADIILNDEKLIDQMNREEIQEEAEVIHKLQEEHHHLYHKEEDSLFLPAHEDLDHVVDATEFQASKPIGYDSNESPQSVEEIQL